MRIEFRMNIITNIDEKGLRDVSISKEVIPYDESEETFHNKDVMRVKHEIYEGDKLIYDKLSPTSIVCFETNNKEYMLKDLTFSLPGLAISSLLPHIMDGFNPDFTINAIIDYCKDSKNFLSYLTDAAKLRIKMRAESGVIA